MSGYLNPVNGQDKSFYEPAGGQLRTGQKERRKQENKRLWGTGLSGRGIVGKEEIRCSPHVLAGSHLYFLIAKFCILKSGDWSC